MMTLGLMVWALCMLVIVGCFHFSLKRWDKKYKQKILMDHHEFMHKLYGYYLLKWECEGCDVPAMFEALSETFNNTKTDAYLYY